MKWIDYREKLGIGFNDNEKYSMLKSKLKLFFTYSKMPFDDNDFVGYSMMIGELLESNSIGSIYRNMVTELTISGFISKCIALYNVYEEHGRYDIEGNPIDKEYKPIFLHFLEKSLSDLKIPYQIENDDDGIFIFPKGAKELDDALVSEPLEWLNDYPNAHKTFVIALKQYSDGIYIRDVADNLRKALETFLQEFLGNGKNLESNKNEICKYLGERGVDTGVSGLYQTLINTYKNLNDRIAKHNDAVDKKMLEFLLYQTGLLIRMVITIKTEESSNAD